MFKVDLLRQESEKILFQCRLGKKRANVLMKTLIKNGRISKELFIAQHQKPWEQEVYFKRETG